MGRGILSLGKCVYLYLLQLDGLLFYHKKAHYTFGASPLVVWLKAYMVPEIIGVEIPQELAALAPSSYTGFSSHADAIRRQQQKRDKKLSKRKSCNGQVVTANAANESMDSEAVICCVDKTDDNPLMLPAAESS